MKSAIVAGLFLCGFVCCMSGSESLSALLATPETPTARASLSDLVSVAKKCKGDDYLDALAVYFLSEKVHDSWKNRKISAVFLEEPEDGKELYFLELNYKNSKIQHVRRQVEKSDFIDSEIKKKFLRRTTKEGKLIAAENIFLEALPLPTLLVEEDLENSSKPVGALLDELSQCRSAFLAYLSALRLSNDTDDLAAKKKTALSRLQVCLREPPPRKSEEKVTLCKFYRENIALLRRGEIADAEAQLSLSTFRELNEKIPQCEFEDSYLSDYDFMEEMRQRALEQEKARH